MLLEYITYKEKKYPIRVSYRTLKGVKADTGKDLEDIGSLELHEYESLLYHSLAAGAKVVDKEPPFTKEDMEDVLDECMMEFVGLIPTFFPSPEKGAGEEGKQIPNQEAANAES